MPCPLGSKLHPSCLFTPLISNWAIKISAVSVKKYKTIWNIQECSEFKHSVDITFCSSVVKLVVYKPTPENTVPSLVIIQ